MTIQQLAMSIIPAITALAGVFLTLKHQEKIKMAEEKRWYADFFLKRKYDSISNLFASLIDWEYTLNLYGNYSPDTIEKYKEEINPKETVYLRDLTISSIYLDDETYNSMKNVLGAFRQVSMAIYYNIQDEKIIEHKKSLTPDITKIDWVEFTKASQEAKKALKEYLNPQILDALELKK
ncbi:MAG: hypothetical protein RBT65_10630 [Methanolobus sp.]|jgi:hypothetical protein|nr:hypothetical protein [Methanolobus sp.]